MESATPRYCRLPGGNRDCPFPAFAGQDLLQGKSFPLAPRSRERRREPGRAQVGAGPTRPTSGGAPRSHTDHCPAARTSSFLPFPSFLPPSSVPSLPFPPSRTHAAPASPAMAPPPPGSRAAPRARRRREAAPPPLREGSGRAPPWGSSAETSS